MIFNYRIQIGAEPVLLNLGAAAHQPERILIKNCASNMQMPKEIFLGGEGVTPENGYPLEKGEKVAAELNPSDAMWAVGEENADIPIAVLIVVT